jgi:PrtD family type I secretion system ABC transporter
MAMDKNNFWRLLRSSGTYFGTAGAFSLAINLLYLAAPLYMLQIYDRVVPSSSSVTLIMLTLVLLLTFLALAGLDSVRARVLNRASLRLDNRIAPKILTRIIDHPASIHGARSQMLRDFDAFRQFISGSGIHAIFDLPWAPVYIAVIFMLHWTLGVFALSCSVVLVLMALLSEWLVRSPLTEANDAAARNYSFTEMSLRNVEVLRALGMKEGLLQRWGRDRQSLLERQTVASDRAATAHSIIRFLRLSAQSVILGMGAYLVIEHAVSAGAIFASSMLLGRALQPVEQITGTWRNLVSVRGALRRLNALFAAGPDRTPSVELPRPRGHLQVQGLTHVLPGRSKPLLNGVSFEVRPGEVLGVIGASGAGKSTLARHLVGVLAPNAGSVRLDGAEVSDWARGGLGQYVGYLPQDIELFADTVANNINRFRPGDDQAILRAARLAGVHELILRLPLGYDTQIGEGGAVLSGGMRQRLALARAVYGEPSLIVLDEPSSNLDGEGDIALAKCIQQIKQAGTAVVMISHQQGTLAVADKLLVLNDGEVAVFGPCAEVMERLQPRRLATASSA